MPAFKLLASLFIALSCIITVQGYYDPYCHYTDQYDRRSLVGLPGKYIIEQNGDIWRIGQYCELRYVGYFRLSNGWYYGPPKGRKNANGSPPPPKQSSGGKAAGPKPPSGGRATGPKPPSGGRATGPKPPSKGNMAWSQ